MPGYTQANRPMAIRTPLGPDALLLTGLRGHEGVSELFRFELELLSDQRTPVVFEKVLGQCATVELELPGGGKRYVDGIVSRLEQGRRDQTFAHFRAELVPKLWLLTRKVRSRTFQHVTVPEILERVLAGIVVKIEVSGTYEPRDYCTQYRESDFAFASRLMEEEGIRYYFRHSSGSHQLIISDDPLDHLDLPGQSEVLYEELTAGGEAEDSRVTLWAKAQEVRSDTYTLRDHCFELPGQSLEAQQLTLESVPVGTVTHRLRVAGEPLEVYDFPGGYAQRFDGVDAQGAPRPEELQHVYTDKERTVRIRMELEEMLGLRVTGTSTCRHLVPGFAFTLCRHFDADGRYLIAGVDHEASLEGDYRTGGTLPFLYRNTFRCIPAALGYRPERVTPRPVIAGTQTATVVAPAGEEIFCDRYGRVKVLFHWDREGRKDPSASCWIRVAQPWAGKGWGAFFWPRAGNEVVVSFEEGDPDRPLIVGSVYNAENMPPFALPLLDEVAGIKSASVRGHASQNFNGVLFFDEKGNEHLSLHSERTMDLNSEWDKQFHAGRNRHECVSNISTGMVGGLLSGGGGGGDDDKWASVKTPFWYDQKGAGALGLEQKLVVGESLTGVCGLHQTIICGSKIEVRANPLGLAGLGATIPRPLQVIAGAGYGGSLIMTMGGNTNITIGGPNIAIKDTKAIELPIEGHWPSKIVCAIIGIVCFLWEATYALTKEAQARNILYFVFQPLLAILLQLLLTFEVYYEVGLIIRDGVEEEEYVLFPPPPGESAADKRKAAWKSIATLPLTAPALVLPIALEAGIIKATTDLPHTES